jgi:hypothetical protein
MAVTGAERGIALLFFSGWAILLWTVAVVKIDRDGFSRFTSHFTNWAWFYGAVLFTLDVFSRMDVTRKFSFFIALFLFWVVNATTWMVFWLVWIALDNNPGLLEAEIKEHGGNFDSGFVFNMHALFHVLPSLMMFLYSVLRRDEIRLAVAFVTDERVFSRTISIIFAILLTIVAPGLLGAVYFLTTNVIEVYKLTVHWSIPVIVGFGVILVHNVVLFVIVYYQVTLSREKHKRSHNPRYPIYI